MPSPWSLLNLPYVQQTHISTQPVWLSDISTTPSSVTHRALTPCQPVPPPPLLFTLFHAMLAGRAGGQTCQSKYHRHAAAPQTPITTQQGRGLATAWQPHGPIRVHNNGDQRRPRKVNEAVCPQCACVRVFELSKTEPKRVRDWQETRSHCVFLISVSCLFSADFQFKLEIISINLLITRVALIKDTVLTCTIISSPMIQKRRLNWKLTHLTAINMLGSLVLMTHYMTIKKKKRRSYNSYFLHNTYYHNDLFMSQYRIRSLSGTLTAVNLGDYRLI